MFISLYCSLKVILVWSLDLVFLHIWEVCQAFVILKKLAVYCMHYQFQEIYKCTFSQY